MQYCRFCQANLEPAAHSCSQCGQFQTEALTQQCLVCQKALPAQAHICPACGHPVGQPATLPDVKNVQEVTVTVATTQQEGTSVAAAQATLSAQQASPKAQGTTAEQAGAAPPLAVVAEPESHSPEESATEAKTGEDK